MKLLLYCILVLGSFQTLSANLTNRIIEAIDNQDATEIIQVFNTVERLKISEAKAILNELYFHYFHKSKNTLREDASKFSLHQSSHISVNYHLNPIFWRSINFKETLKCAGEFSISIVKNYVSLRTFYYAEKFSCFLRTDKEIADEDIPTNLVLGALEVLVGGLVCILPFPGAKWIGGTMIADGINRSFNGLAELDDHNKGLIFGKEPLKQ